MKLFNLKTLKAGQAIYNQAGQKVDEVEAVTFGRLGAAGGKLVTTRAGYTFGINKDGSNAFGYTNVR